MNGTPGAPTAPAGELDPLLSWAHVPRGWGVAGTDRPASYRDRWDAGDLRLEIDLGKGRRVLKGFKDFLLRGNVVDLAVAVVIGAAFTAVVTAFTNSFLKPLIQLVSPGSGQFAGTATVDGVVFDYADFINQTITFVLTAAVVYFMIVAPMKAIQARRLRGEESGPVESTDIELLAEIRDLLAQQAADRDGATSREGDAASGPPDPVAVALDGAIAGGTAGRDDRVGGSRRHGRAEPAPATAARAGAPGAAHGAAPAARPPHPSAASPTTPLPAATPEPVSAGPARGAHRS
ncbi:hypothetical protein Acsp06_53540 [Actinomycetospora sp. NBRC 106375]|nr:hypothetical protein Acsp06_53540 [Actinomycetospora sp. NBRC 106375]